VGAGFADGLVPLREAGRVIVTRKLTPVVENLAERYARREGLY